jgi:outer membrane protein assembly factor BamB
VAAALVWWLLRSAVEDAPAAASASPVVRVLLAQEGGVGLGQPCLSETEGLVVVGDAQGRVAFWELGSGSVQPRKSLVTLGSEAIAAAPVSAGDGVWLVGDESGVMYCFTRSGQIRWQFRTGGQIQGAAAVYGDLVVFGSYDQVLYAVGLADGQERWRLETGGYINGRPVLDTKHGWLVFGNCDGRLQKVSAADGRELARLEFGSPIPETPTLSHGLCLILTHDGELVAVEVATFQEVWRVRSDDNYVSSPVVAGNAVLMTTSAGLVHAYWPKEGRWQRDVTGGVAATPVAAAVNGGGAAYAVTADGQLLRLAVAGETTAAVLHHFQRDCDQGVVVGDRHIVFVALDGTLIAAGVE